MEGENQLQPPREETINRGYTEISFPPVRASENLTNKTGWAVGKINLGLTEGMIPIPGLKPQWYIHIIEDNGQSSYIHEVHVELDAK